MPTILLTIFSNTPASPRIVKNKTAKMNMAPVGATFLIPASIYFPRSLPCPKKRHATIGMAINADIVDNFFVIIDAKTSKIVISPTIANILNLLILIQPDSYKKESGNHGNPEYQSVVAFVKYETSSGLK